MERPVRRGLDGSFTGLGSCSWNLTPPVNHCHQPGFV
ncbi:rCG22255 [Rattus norvegicus]|uniref:RCG22255 n=1 Tax=Rattus norvegicus TaxID=10116 RepID=A6INH5_RAT|nr:rCG22255 [Rattus norvegicus]